MSVIVANMKMMASMGTIGYFYLLAFFFLCMYVRYVRYHKKIASALSICNT